MSDVSKLSINGQTYNVKDSVARSSVNVSQELANTCKDRLDEFSAKYNSSTETISFNINR